MNLQELKEQKEEITIQLNELGSSLEDGQVFNEDQIKQFDALEADLVSLNDQIQTKERLNNLPSLKADKTDNRIKPVAFSQKPVDNSEVFRGWALSQINRKEHLTPSMLEASRASNVAFDAPIQGAVKWDQTVGTDASGGFAVNEAVVAGVVQVMKDFGGMLSASTVFNTSDGAPLKKVVHNSTNFKASKTAELGTIANTNQVISTVTFGATELTSGIYQTSLQLVRDSAYDILGEFQRAVGESLSRKMNELFTIGTGTNEPEGISGVSSLDNSTLGYTDILDLIHSVDPSYRRSPKAAFMCSDPTVLALKKTLIDSDGRPMFKNEPNTVGGFGYVVEGFPVIVNNDLDDNVLIFGDFSKFEIRLVGNLTVRVLNELYALSNGVGIVAHAACDSRIVDPTAFNMIEA